LFEQGAVYFLDIKDYQKAIEVFQQYISEYPDDEHTWPAYRCLAKCYENTGNTSQAIAVLQEALNSFSESKYADAIKEKLDKIQEGVEQ
jgi:TolA-binding protein